MKWIVGLALGLAGAAAVAAEPAQSAAPEIVMEPVKVEIRETATGYQLFRGGKPYRIRGAGIDHADLEAFAAHGGNSFRTWAVDDGALPASDPRRAAFLGVATSHARAGIDEISTENYEGSHWLGSFADHIH